MKAIVPLSLMLAGGIAWWLFVHALDIMLSSIGDFIVGIFR